MGGADWPASTDPHRMLSSKPGAEKMKTRLMLSLPMFFMPTHAPDTRWTDVAHALGYHDQMHMVHDFNRLSGDSPTAIGSQLDMFVQPEVVSAARPR
jgi:AraC-like DNA-binding protein